MYPTNHLTATDHLPTFVIFSLHKSTMDTEKNIPTVASDLNINDLVHLEAQLERKLERIPMYIVPSLTINDVLLSTLQVLQNPATPPDLQLPFLWRNRATIDRDNAHPIKNDSSQSLNITRAIFFYHMQEAHQFQRYHDTSRWNLALFTALLCVDAIMPAQVSVEHEARLFMISYLAAVMERHNMPTVFYKREEFIKLWKASKWSMFQYFRAGQSKLLKKEMSQLNAEWEVELDYAMRVMGKREYYVRVAPFVRSVVPGREDQGQVQIHLEGGAIKEDESSESMEKVDIREKNELLEALMVPLEAEPFKRHQEDQDTMTPVDMSVAIAAMQMVRPGDMLPVLLRFFPVAEVADVLE
ncbi:hypothetical protein BDU57DRAFT_514106 [Ampelomyces quisqualis]|uniref:Uncharacterized protein n=1 Tax=Ampelomyces quisqualis TaxID=50730 RepID=A0A6A5QS70_AMPQU|nr:hypothetical protein BDU57DRAFT_514106 [Ampelomyces quisqualis]